MLQRTVIAVLCISLLAACASRPAKVGRGGYYQDDGPGAHVPADVSSIPDAKPRREPLNRAANQPYTVLGRDYVPLREVRPFRQRGVASWYGRKFHGQKTSSGEIYDMYAMTAAHPTLPIPSYARVTNPANGRSVVVRVNDRGPFIGGRIVDLSYSAAAKLGLVAGGSGEVILESVLPGESMPTAVATVPRETADDDAIARLAARADVPVLPEVKDSGGTWLQLGAFANRDNAESFRSHLADPLAAFGDSVVVRSQGDINRVQLGPFRDAAEARRVAAKLRDVLALQPVVVQH